MVLSNLKTYVLLTIKTEEGNVEVVLGRSGEFRIVEPGTNKVIVTNNIPYGSYLYVKDGSKITKGDEFVHGIRTTRLSYLNLQVKLSLMLYWKVSLSVKNRMSKLVTVKK